MNIPESITFSVLHTNTEATIGECSESDIQAFTYEDTSSPVNTRTTTCSDVAFRGSYANHNMLLPSHSVDSTNTYVSSALQCSYADVPTINARPIPKFIFIVPYRNREIYLDIFIKHMTYVLEDISPDDYRIVVIHQSDMRSFNRGATKNIGFLYVKELYPEDYEDITLVFNDIDTMPKHKQYLQYIAHHGTIKHFFGFKHTLGGIFSITGKDFERIGGFPNYWGWGYEDNLLQVRATRAGIQIDRSCFYDLTSRADYMDDSRFLCVNSGVWRDVSKSEYARYISDKSDTFISIRDLEYNISENVIPAQNVIPAHIPIKNETPQTLPVYIPQMKDTMHMKSVHSFIEIAGKRVLNPVPYIVVNATRFNTDIRDDQIQKIQYNILNGNTSSGQSRRGRKPAMLMRF
jgi:hypothetical protein